MRADGQTNGRTDGRTDSKNNVAIAYPYHAGKSCSKFSLIPPSGLGGGSMRPDGRTNGRTDGKIMYFALAHPYQAG